MLIVSLYIRIQSFLQLCYQQRILLIKILTGKRITDPTSGMRMVNRKLIKEFTFSYPKDYPEPESVVTVMCRGYRAKEVPVKMRSRSEGESSISMRKSVYYMIKVSMAIIIARICK